MQVYLEGSQVYAGVLLCSEVYGGVLLYFKLLLWCHPHVQSSSHVAAK
jgi:hypothetical protein